MAHWVGLALLADVLSTRCLGDRLGFRGPCPPFGSWIDVQVPPRTNFQALPWKSTVEVPWQVVPGPAAQSFWPLRATPKHFSLWAATAAFPSAFVSGPAAAIVTMAAVSAPARMNELTALPAHTGFSTLGSSEPQLL